MLSALGQKSEPQTGWIRWIHEGKGGNHCPICISLGDCMFLESNMPMQPVHPFCHCSKEKIKAPVAGIDVYAVCEERKFKNYGLIFLPKDDKSGWFLKYGYDIMDADYLIQEYVRQATIKYAAGEYKLAELPGEYGQKVEIAITLKNKIKGGMIEVLSIWMIEPNGRMRLVTPIIGVTEV